jgi:hypothetical protein
MQEPMTKARCFSTFFHTKSVRDYPSPSVNRNDRGVVIFPNDAKNMRLGHHLMVDGGSGCEDVEFQGLWVVPTSKMKAFVERNLIAVDYDTLHYKLIIFPDGANLYVEYGQIIGSRLVASLTLDSLPQVIRVTA